MSVYRMIRRLVEFDAERALAAAAQERHFTNTAGLIEAMKAADAKFVFAVGDEDDIGTITDERLRLAASLRERAYGYIREDRGDKAFRRITDAAAEIARQAQRDDAPTSRP